MAGYGGETPLAYQDSKLTAEAPAATTALVPTVKGGVYRLIGGTAADGSAYKMVAASDEDTAASTILCIALEAVTSETSPCGVLVLNPYGGFVVKLKYKVAPTLGQSVKVSSDLTTVDGDTWGRGAGTVVAIDTVNLEVEVLFA